jgi:hypothetical protein
MTLYTELSDARLTVATDYYFLSARSKSKDTDVGNLRDTELH